MPAKSKSQRRLMGMALAYKRGELDDKYASDTIKKLAKDMDEKDLEDFAKTDEDDLPEKVPQEEENMNISVKEFKEMRNIILSENKDLWTIKSLNKAIKAGKLTKKGITAIKLYLAAEAGLSSGRTNLFDLVPYIEDIEKLEKQDNLWKEGKIIEFEKMVNDIIFEDKNYWPFKPGGVEIWYWNKGAGRDMLQGYDWLAKKGKLPNKNTLKKTHKLLGKVNTIILGNIFDSFQGHKWSPNGEANDRIKSLGLSHTSMSVGDIVKIRHKMWIADVSGWKKI